jgi:DNA-binding response OmpR family regulator
LIFLVLGAANMAKSILLVDDEPNIVLSLEFLMKRAGYAVRTATDGDAALEAITEDRPDLILLDVNMPKRDGFEICQLIRSNPGWKDIPIIMLTAKGRDVEREKGLAMGADDYVTKPFATQEVVEKVEAILGKAS